MSVVFSGARGVRLYRMITLHSGLGLEIKGMRLSRKAPTCYSIIKREYGLKGNRQRVLDQFEILVEEAKAGAAVKREGGGVEVS